MSTIVRPIKRGDVHTFDESYNKGFKNIWASEVDSEFDVLFDAWNFGAINIADSSVTSDKIATGAVTSDKIAFGAVDSVHIADGSVTEADLADPVSDRLVPPYDSTQALKIMTVDATGNLVWVDAPPAQLLPGQVTTQYIADAPNGITDAKITSVAWSKVTGAPTSLPPTGPAGGDFTGTYPSPQLGPGVVGAPEIADASISNIKITDLAWAKVTGAPTTMPPSGAAGGGLSGSYPSPTVVTAAGDFSVAGNQYVAGLLRNRTYQSGLYGGGALPVVQGQALGVTFEQNWFNNVAVAPNPGAGWIYSPNFNTMSMAWAYMAVDRNNGFGCSLQIQISTDGVNWSNLSYDSSAAGLNFMGVAMYPAPSNARWRCVFTNASGYNPVYLYGRYFIVVDLGYW